MASNEDAARVVCLYENLSEIRPFVGRRHPPATPDAPAARSPKIRRSMSNCPAPSLLVDKPTRNGERLTFLRKEKSEYDGGATRSRHRMHSRKKVVVFCHNRDSATDYRRTALLRRVGQKELLVLITNSHDCFHKSIPYFLLPFLYTMFLYLKIKNVAAMSIAESTSTPARFAQKIRLSAKASELNGE